MGIANKSNSISNSYVSRDVVNQLPLDKAFLKAFKDVRAGGKKRKSNNRNSRNSKNLRRNKSSRKYRSRRNRRRNQKAGSVNYILRVGEEKIGGLARVDKFETQPVYKGNVPEVNQNDLVKGLCGGYKKKSSKNNKNRKNRKNKKGRKSKKNMRGGNSGGCFKVQPDAQPSHYSENMSTRKFDCNQPNWDPKCT